MEQGAMEKIRDKIHKAVSKINITGIKLQKPHEFIRGMITIHEEKFAIKGVHKIEKHLAAMGEEIEQHLVAKVEDKEVIIAAGIVKEFSLLFCILHNMAIFEKQEVLELRELEEVYTTKLEPKLGDDQKKEAARVFKEALNAWDKELKAFRKQINAVFADAKGGTGFALGMYKTMHGKDGYFKRRKERNLTKAILHDGKALKKIAKKLAKVKTKEEFETEMKAIADTEKEAVNAFLVIDKMVLTSWENVTDLLNKLVEIVAKAAGIHELPSKDSAEMHELMEMILKEEEDKELSNLRTVINQLDGYLRAAESKAPKS